jgi:hypothetical protein
MLSKGKVGRGDSGNLLNWELRGNDLGFMSPSSTRGMFKFFQKIIYLFTSNKGILKLVKFSVISGHS